jgi:citrate lyase subunit beta/citryl-CoA lyase
MERSFHASAVVSRSLLRSLLFAPGSDTRKLAKVRSFGADAVVLDLEDAVADSEKEAARIAVRAALEAFEADGAAVFVRVNSARSGLMEGDVESVVCARLDGVLLPKVEAPEELAELDRLLGKAESSRDLPDGGVSVLALVETALGVVRCEEIALAAPARVLTLVFGLGDFSVDMCVDLSSDATELLYARSRVAVAARAARMPPALDGPYPDLRDTRGLIEDTRRSRQLGFQGRVAVYPPQVEPIQRVYSDLAPEEAALARKIVSSFELAEASGSASIQVDGHFIDYPIFERAKQKLQRYEALEAEAGK